MTAIDIQKLKDAMPPGYRIELDALDKSYKVYKTGRRTPILSRPQTTVVKWRRGGAESVFLYLIRRWEREQ